MPVRFLALLLMMSGGLSCSTLAGIDRRTGPSLEARIDFSDEQRLYVTEYTGAHYTVERSDVVAIHHPGTPTLVIGTIVSSIGALVLAMAPVIKHYQDDNDVDFAAIAALEGVGCLVVGMFNLVHGLAVRSRSQRAAEIPVRGLLPAPAVLPRLACPSCAGLQPTMR
jgi:hypothetical protein